MTDSKFEDPGGNDGSKPIDLRHQTPSDGAAQIDEAGKTTQPGRQCPVGISGTTTEILGEMRAGNHTRQEVLYERYWPRIREWVRMQLGTHLRRRVDSEDLAQETFASFLRDVHSLCPEDSRAFEALMRRLIKNRICDAHDWHKAIRRDVKREADLESAGWVGLSDPRNNDPPEQAAIEEERIRVRIATGLLDSWDQAVISAFDPTRPQAVAETLNLGADVARQQIAAAFDRLRRVLKHLTLSQIDDALQEADAGRGPSIDETTAP